VKIPENTGLDYPPFSYQPPGTTQTHTYDSPSIGIIPGGYAVYNITATMWYMCEATVGSGVWVPLGSLTWEWSIDARYPIGGTVGWNKQPYNSPQTPFTFSAVSDVAPDSAFPKWTRYLTNGQTGWVADPGG